MTEATDIHALAGAYALDAVDDLERAAFERHLHQCVTCALEVSELRETATRLAGGVAEVPPQRLRDSVLAAAARTAQDRPGTPDRLSHSGAAAVNRWRRWTAAAVAAGIVGVGAALGTWAVAEDRVRDSRAQAAAEAQRSRELADLLAAPDAVVRKQEMAGGSVTVVVSRSQDRGLAVLAGLRPPAPDQVYQLWTARDATAHMDSAGTVPAGTGTGTVAFGQVRDKGVFGLSIEPGPGGSTEVTPTGVVGTMPL